MVADEEPKTIPGHNQGPIDSDLVHEIPGMYRLLDLISEPGSGGLGARSLRVVRPVI